MANRPVMGMDGFGGQTILIDFERGRIIATQSIHDNMMFPQPGGIDFKKISYERIKNGKPSSKSKPTPKQVVDSQQIIKERNAAIETEKKAKQYWDDYYDCTETSSGKSNVEACIDKIVKNIRILYEILRYICLFSGVNFIALLRRLLRICLILINVYIIKMSREAKN